jgi:nucleotidyltransferase substrate binding protein (TIGR01987 family)
MKSKLDTLKKSAENAIVELEKGINWLDQDKNAGDRWARLDAVAKRFEVSFEYFWKYLKAALEWQGTDAPGPRPTLQEAARYGWIIDMEKWAGFLEARNSGVHDYFGLSSEEYAQEAAAFLHESKNVLKRIPPD